MISLVKQFNNKFNQTINKQVFALITVTVLVLFVACGGSGGTDGAE